MLMDDDNGNISLTDQELYDKILKLNTMSMHYARLGLSSMTASIEDNLAILKDELAYRTEVKAAADLIEKEVTEKHKTRFSQKKRVKAKKINPNVVATFGHIKGVDDK